MKKGQVQTLLRSMHMKLVVYKICLARNCILLLGDVTLRVCLFIFSEVRVEGLETSDYLDNLKNRERFTEQGDTITFEGEVSVALCCLSSFYLCF